jgi:hypothetical protein
MNLGAIRRCEPNPVPPQPALRIPINRIGVNLTMNVVSGVPMIKFFLLSVIQQPTFYEGGHVTIGYAIKVLILF